MDKDRGQVRRFWEGSWGMAFSVFGSVTGDYGITYLLWTLQSFFLIPKTYWLNGVWVSPLTCLRICLHLLQLFGLLYLFGNLPGVHCSCYGLSHKAFEVCFGRNGRP